ncbi:MAG: D-TA family PLP-dependent enzyme [Planctomycetaceae bacterium]|nr:D-TA family PLP-dependent enzyme [Planctomycetaceae bacterium]
MANWYEVENIASVATPALLLYPERIRQNLQAMARRAGDVSRLRPHVKTHKLPQIVQMKRELGIEKFKTATLVETWMVAQAGGRDVLWAYQPVGPNPSQFTRLIRKFPEVRFSTLLDDFAAARQLSAAAVQANVVIEVFLDLNVGMNRSGMVPGEAALQLYLELDRLPGLRPVGLHAYDGHVRAADMNLRREQWQAVVEQTLNLVGRIEASSKRPAKIVAGGSSTSWLWLEVPGVEVGAGTMALWDYGQTLTCPESEMVHAAVLAARVISRPQPDLLCLDLGHKAVAAEMPQPRVHWFGLEDARPVLQSEEHLVLQTPRAASFPVGSVCYGLPHHICPTTALYDEVWTIEQGQAVGRWPVVARGRQLTWQAD